MAQKSRGEGDQRPQLDPTLQYFIAPPKAETRVLHALMAVHREPPVTLSTEENQRIHSVLWQLLQTPKALAALDATKRGKRSSPKLRDRRLRIAIDFQAHLERGQDRKTVTKELATFWGHSEHPKTITDAAKDERDAAADIIKVWLAAVELPEKATELARLSATVRRANWVVEYEDFYGVRRQK